MSVFPGGQYQDLIPTQRSNFMDSHHNQVCHWFGYVVDNVVIRYIAIVNSCVPRYVYDPRYYLDSRSSPLE